jgi:glycerophosphoryl diester phosphodiesterase
MKPLRIGHRGAAGYAPENTILSIEKAIAIGVDLVEIDVNRTRDGHLVVIHDPRVDRTTDGEGCVGDLDLGYLRSLHTIPGHQQIPTLREVLDAINGRVGVMIEIKVPAISPLVVDVVRQAAVRSPVYYASFLHDELLCIREVDKDRPTIALLEGVPVDRIGFARDARATHAGLALDCLSPEFIETLHAAGISVFTYTADDLRDIAYAQGCKVDGIISNFPDRL